MRRACERCDRFYDDATSWTICPHNPLHVAPDAALCTYHDLFNCKLPHASPRTLRRGLFFVADVRRRLFFPWDCSWNGFVRDITARLEGTWLIRSER